MSRIHYAPLSSGFMVSSILGFIISLLWVMDKSVSWGFTLTLFFVIMFISGLVSMTQSEAIPIHMNELAVHEPARKRIAQREHPMPRPIKKYKFHYFDIIFLIYFFMAVLYGFALLAYSTSAVSPIVFTILLALTVIIGMAMIVEIISEDKIEHGHQALLIMLIVLTLPFGMLLYYIIRKFI